MGNRRGGLFFGVIVGTLLGILFAPRKGKELRKQLKDEVKKGGVGAETLKKNFMEMGHDMAETAEEVYHMPEVQDQVEKGKKHVGKFMREAETHINKAERQIKDMGEKYLDLDEEKMEKVTSKIHKASAKVKGKLQSLRQKFMGDVGFRKKRISGNGGESEKRRASPKSRGASASKKSRTRKVKIRKQRG